VSAVATGRLFTTAPVEYDAAFTRTVRVVGPLTKRGDALLREVELAVEPCDLDGDLEWQAARYLSGLHECWTPGDFEALASITGLRASPLPGTDALVELRATLKEES
jgi:hypothetical protein